MAYWSHYEALIGRTVLYRKQIYEVLYEGEFHV